MGEVDGDVYFGVGQHLELVGDANVDVGTADQRPDALPGPGSIDRSAQHQLGILGDRAAHLASHATVGTDDADANHRRRIYATNSDKSCSPDGPTTARAQGL